MKIVRMNPLNGNGKIAAFFDVQTNDEILIKGFRIIKGTSGLFIATPNEKGKDGKYYDTVIFPKELKSDLEQIALDEYNKIR